MSFVKIIIKMNAESYFGKGMNLGGGCSKQQDLLFCFILLKT